jgi:hypothetical protein
VFHRTTLTLAAVGFVIAKLGVSAAANPAEPRADLQSVVTAGAGHRPVDGQPVSYYDASSYWRSIWWADDGYPWEFDAYGPYGFLYAHPFPLGYFPADFTAALRLQVMPREAEVFVDGYRAGEVDDFDGVFQRLRLSPGGHEIAVYLEGYRTFRQNLYLNPGSTETIRHELERLAPGESMEPRPSPIDRRQARPPDATVNPPTDPRPHTGLPVQGTPSEASTPRRAFGTLSLRVQPVDAEVVVDDQSWTVPNDSPVLAIELAEGRHRVEVRKTGFAPYREIVLIRRGMMMRLNVSLSLSERQ